MADYLKIIEEFEKEQAARRYTWRDFYPGLHPDHWQITETEDGIFGRRVKGKLAGTIVFYLSRERLAAGPSPQRRQPSRWDFQKVTIGKDTWMVGVADTGAETCWFIGDPGAKQE